ncbi:MAG: NUDIX hydrolase [Gemmatimonadota bacterium]|nr:NUDIX hydrolase [Gemmatimonadota bacterium]
MTGDGGPGRLDGARVYSGRVIDVELDRVRFPDGSIGELELIRHPGASAIVALRPGPAGTRASGVGQPNVLLIRQYRYAADGFVWEVPAGKLDAGEQPEACALRELEEETGFRAGRLERLSTIHTTPGFTDEVIHLFLATELEVGTSSHGATEFIELHEIPLASAIDMIDRGEISDAKSICALTLAARAIGGT